MWFNLNSYDSGVPLYINILSVLLIFNSNPFSGTLLYENLKFSSISFDVCFLLMPLGPVIDLISFILTFKAISAS